jgi:hypothetical protein
LSEDITSARLNKGEMESYTIILYHAYTKKNMIGAWEQCGGELQWCESYSNLVK